MDPISVLRTLWRHKWVALPVVLMTLAACGYIYLFAPRTYEATVSYALTAPDTPNSYALEHDESLAKLNANNPYLRSNDSSLVAQVVIAKLSDPAFVEHLRVAGFATDFKIVPVGSFGMGLLNVSASADSVTLAESTAKFLGEQFTGTLRQVQKVNGADDRYLYSPILINGPGPAQELFSSRLRSMIMMGIGGGVLLFGVVSGANSYSIHTRRRRTSETAIRSAAGSDDAHGNSQTALGDPRLPVPEEPADADVSPPHEANEHGSGSGNQPGSHRRPKRLAYVGDMPRDQ